MDAIMKIVEGETSEEFDFNSIDQDKLKMFQSKCTIWDFNNISKEEYMNKHTSAKKDLIISYYNIWLKVCFCFCRLDSVNQDLGSGLCL